MVVSVEPIDVHNCLDPSRINPLRYLVPESLGSFKAAIGENGETGVINGEYIKIAIMGQSQSSDFIQSNNCATFAGR